MSQGVFSMHETSIFLHRAQLQTNYTQRKLRMYVCLGFVIKLNFFAYQVQVCHPPTRQELFP